MIKSQPMENVLEVKNFAFIDNNNLNLAIQELGWKLDFKRFRVYLKEKYDFEKAYLFIGIGSSFVQQLRPPGDESRLKSPDGAYKLIG